MKTTRALVLSGGGPAGLAWELGVLLGLADAGVDVAGQADVVIGTSAGAAVGAQITSGEPLETLFSRQLAPTTTELEVEFDDERLQEMAEAEAGIADEPELWRRIGEIALGTPTVPEATRREVIRNRLPSPDWPARRLLITAVDIEGLFTVFDASSGVSLLDAATASGAVPTVWPPATIGEHRYMDGGVRSATNADLSAGSDVVVVLAPALPGFSDQVPAELVAAGVPASVVITSDAATLSAFGDNPLDPNTRRASALAGRALGRVEAVRVAAVWNK